jgi:hypothetical protein
MNIVLDKLRNWITAADPRLAMSGVIFVLLVAGGLTGALFGGLGPLLALGLVGAVVVGVLMLRSTQVGLFTLVALFIFIFGLRYGGLNVTVARNFLEVLLAVSLFFLVINQVQTLEQVNQVSRVIIIAGGVAAALGIFFYVIPGEWTVTILSRLRVFQYPTENILRYIEDDPEQPMRAIATSIDPNALGGLLVFLTIITVTHLFAHQPIMPRPYLALSAGLMTLTLYLTFSRGSLVGVAAGLGVIAVLRYRKLLWVMLAALGLMLVLPQTQFYVQRFIEGVQGEDLSTQMRWGEYKDAFNLISRYPLTGVGFFGTPDIDVYVGVSSVYLLLAQQMGLVGAGLYAVIGLAYLAVMVSTLTRLPHGHPLETPLLAYGLAILGAMVGGVFDHFYFNLTFIHIAALYWTTLGLGMAARQLLQKSPQTLAPTASAGADIDTHSQ